MENNRYLSQLFNCLFYCHLLLFMDQQDEYEELLRYAVVAPKIETLTSAHMQQPSTSYLSAEGRTSQRKHDAKSQRPAGILDSS